jgi:hypothetical protein
MRHLASVGRTGCLFLVLAGLSARTEAGVDTFPHLSSLDNRMVDAVRLGAMRRLRTKECRRVLTDFKDSRGRTALENLEPYAQAPEEYLSTLLFFDGMTRRLCRGNQSQLVTILGSGANVFVCRPFFQTAWRDRTMAEMYVIHEMLHTLGVGENPPTSTEITHQVLRRCGS